MKKEEYKEPQYYHIKNLNYKNYKYPEKIKLIPKEERNERPPVYMRGNVKIEDCLKSIAKKSRFWRAKLPV